MVDDNTENKQALTPPPDPEHNFETTPAIDLSYEMAETDEQKKMIADRLDTWSSQVKEEVYAILRKHGIARYQLSYYHNGTKELFLSGSDNVYEAAVLAKTTYVTLCDQVQRRLSI